MMRSNCGARSVTRAMLAMAVLGTAMFPSGVVRADDDDAQKGAKMELAGDA
jgi:hypothetical protein